MGGRAKKKVRKIQVRGGGFRSRLELPYLSLLENRDLVCGVGVHYGSIEGVRKGEGLF